MVALLRLKDDPSAQCTLIVHRSSVPRTRAQKTDSRGCMLKIPHAMTATRPRSSMFAHAPHLTTGALLGRHPRDRSVITKASQIVLFAPMIFQAEVILCHAPLFQRPWFTPRQETPVVPIVTSAAGHAAACTLVIPLFVQGNRGVADSCFRRSNAHSCGGR